MTAWARTSSPPKPLTVREERAALRKSGLSEVAVAGILGMALEDFTPEQPRSALSTTPTTLAAWAITHLRPVL